MSSHMIPKIRSSHMIPKIRGDSGSTAASDQIPGPVYTGMQTRYTKQIIMLLISGLGFLMVIAIISLSSVIITQKSAMSDTTAKYEKEITDMMPQIESSRKMANDLLSENEALKTAGNKPAGLPVFTDCPFFRFYPPTRTIQCGDTTQTKWRTVAQVK